LDAGKRYTEKVIKPEIKRKLGRSIEDGKGVQFSVNMKRFFI